MIRWLADENFNNDIVRALLRRCPHADLVRAQDVGLRGVDDPTVLAWASEENRAVLTHDVTTFSAYAYARVSAGQPMSGVFEISRGLEIARVLEDLVLLTECSETLEWEGQVIYLPLRYVVLQSLKSRHPMRSAIQ